MNFVEMKLSPHEKWGDEHVGAPKGHVCNLNSLRWKVSQKHA